jgi:hypothetical protein
MRCAHKVFLACLVPVLMLLGGCQQQFVSPYSADLQKRATDMLADVSTWEGAMRNAAGTAAADPRNPDVVAKLQSWNGDIEAMATIEVGIDPGSTVCDKFLGEISSAVQSALGPTATSASGSAPIAAHCETLPDIFSRMKTQVGERMPRDLAQQCQVPWLSDAYFAAMAQNRATTGAPAAAKPQPAATAAQPGTPTAAQASLATERCAALFDTGTSAGGNTLHGALAGPLVTELAAIIYREGREAPPATK